MRENKIILRKFESGDLERVLAIERLSFAIDPWPAGRFKYCYREQPDGFIVAEKNNKVVGYIVSWITRGRGGIGSIAVDPKYRRTGVGYQLAAYILNYFKEKKIKQVKIEVRTTNEGSVRFFKSVHFKIVETLKGFYSDGGDAYLMEKKL